MIRFTRSFHRRLGGRAKVTIICIATLFGFVLLSPKQYNVQFDGIIPEADPSDVWKYLMDFNNMLTLNPTIENFSITRDNGDYINWQYSVIYTEHLSNLPFIKNTAHAHYQVYILLPQTTIEVNKYIIDSNHTTCFFGPVFCVNSSSKFTCRRKDERNTYCNEDVTYECPRLAYFFCYSEVMHQRRTIFKNLIQMWSP